VLNLDNREREREVVAVVCNCGSAGGGQ